MRATTALNIREVTRTMSVGLGIAPSSAEQPTAGQCCKSCTQCGRCGGVNHCFCFCNCSGIGTSYCWTSGTGCIQSGCISCVC
jgi:hypothetical protein